MYIKISTYNDLIGFKFENLVETSQDGNKAIKINLKTYNIIGLKFVI